MRRTYRERLEIANDIARLIERLADSDEATGMGCWSRSALLIASERKRGLTGYARACLKAIAELTPER